MDLTSIVSRFENCQQQAEGFSARCPSHDDKHNSLSIYADDERILIHCHAGCRPEEIVQAVGLSMADLFQNNSNGARRIVATYDYCDEQGNLLSQTVRYVPKDFRQRRPDGHGGWIWNLHGVRRVPYRLPELLASQDAIIFIVEGEKDVDALYDIGLNATCNVGGASKGKSKWTDSLNPHFQDREVVIIPDNDANGTGRVHAERVAASLQGFASTVRVVELPDAKDVSEWLAAGNSADELMALADAAKPWQPAVEALPKHNPQLPTILHDEGRTEAANAKRFVKHYGAIVRWCDPWGQWLVWDGMRWKIDDCCHVRKLGLVLANELWEELNALARKADRLAA